MKNIRTYHSPHISYEIYEEDSCYHINAYIENEKNSDNPQRHVLLRNFSRDLETAEIFAKAVSDSAALPVHMEELAESFLSR